MDNISLFFSLFIKKIPRIDGTSRAAHNTTVLTDAHLHLADLESRDPEFHRFVSGRDWIGAAVSHDEEEHRRSVILAGLLPSCILGFGIHPQGIRDDTAEFAESLAEEGKISFVGEAGFDFFGDVPKRTRNPASLDAQRKAFEFQLRLAARHRLPMVVHIRKATDILRGYGRSLALLPGVVFHGWPGRALEAKAFLDQGVKAYFSFGTPLLRGARHAEESIAYLSPDRLLSETDAPWQPPFGQAHTSLPVLDEVAGRIARLKGIPREEMDGRLRENFLRAFCL